VGRIVVCTMLSVDGYTEGPGGDVMAMPMDAAFAAHNTDRARTASSFLFRGTTYRGALTCWPRQHGNPDASPLDHYIAKRYAEGIPITVVSDTLTADDTGPCATRRRSSGVRTWGGSGQRGAQRRVGRIGAMSRRTGPRPARRALLGSAAQPGIGRGEAVLRLTLLLTRQARIVHRVR
jgi:hypothetical protein